MLERINGNTDLRRREAILGGLIAWAALEIFGLRNAFAEESKNALQNSSKLLEQKYTLMLGETQIEIIITSKNGDNITYVNVHDNENVSVEAVKTILHTNGGRLVELRHNGERNIKFLVDGKTFEIDPNRFFTDEGIRRNLIKLNGQSSPKAEHTVKQFVQNFLEVSGLSQNRTIVAVHNNTPDNLTVHSSDLAPVKVMVFPNRDTDDFFLVTQNQDFEALEQRGFNVILSNARGASGGSLSEYCAERNIRYINVEAQHGEHNAEKHLAEQREMLMTLRSILLR